MTTINILDKLSKIIQELMAFYGELSQELPNLRFAEDKLQTPKKICLEMCYIFRRQRRIKKKNHNNLLC